jgi:lysozyme
MMKTSNRGVLELCEHEGIVPAPYRDSVGVWTWGVGHTAAAGGPDPEQMPRAFPVGEQAINDEIVRAIKQLAVDLVRYEDDVNQAIRVPLEQHEFDALVSFHYNTGGIHQAKLTDAINAGRSDAADRFMGWLKPPEIRGRRTAEMRLFQTGDYDANGDQIPVWGTNGNGKLTRPIRTVNGAWVLDVMGRGNPEPLPVKMPSEAKQVIEDADKNPALSRTIWGAVAGVVSAGWSAFQSADPMVQIAMLGVVAVLLFIFAERIRKMRLGRAAKRALGFLSGDKG